MTSPRLRLDHIGIAVENLAEARTQFARLLGMEPSPIEEVPQEDVRVSFFELGGCRIELLEGMTAASSVRRFLEKRRSGVHHISLALEDGDIDEHFHELKGRGLQLLGNQPSPGSGGSRVFFIHPSSTSGVLFELSQAAPGQQEGKAP